MKKSIVFTITLLSYFNIFSQEEITFEEIKDSIMNRKEVIFSFGDLESKPIFGKSKSYIFNDKKIENYINCKINKKFRPKRKVAFSFVINKNGNVSNIKVLIGFESPFLEEMIKALRKMPSWNVNFPFLGHV